MIPAEKKSKLYFGWGNIKFLEVIRNLLNMSWRREMKVVVFSFESITSNQTNKFNRIVFTFLFFLFPFFFPLVPFHCYKKCKNVEQQRKSSMKSMLTWQPTRTMPWPMTN